MEGANGVGITGGRITDQALERTAHAWMRREKIRVSRQHTGKEDEEVKKRLRKTKARIDQAIQTVMRCSAQQPRERIMRELREHLEEATEPPGQPQQMRIRNLEMGVRTSVRDDELYYHAGRGLRLVNAEVALMGREWPVRRTCGMSQKVRYELVIAKDTMGTAARMIDKTGKLISVRMIRGIDIVNSMQTTLSDTQVRQEELMAPWLQYAQWAGIQGVSRAWKGIHARAWLIQSLRLDCYRQIELEEWVVNMNTGLNLLDRRITSITRAIDANRGGRMEETGRGPEENRIRILGNDAEVGWNWNPGVTEDEGED